jgi:hypothetical protein
MAEIRPLDWQPGKFEGSWIATTPFGAFRIKRSASAHLYYCLIPEDMVGHVTTEKHCGSHFTRDSLEGAQKAAGELLTRVVDSVDHLAATSLLAWFRDARVPSRLHMVSPVGTWTIKPQPAVGFICTPPTSITRVAETHVTDTIAMTVRELQEWVSDTLAVLCDKVRQPDALEAER